MVRKLFFELPPTTRKMPNLMIGLRTNQTKQTVLSFFICLHWCRWCNSIRDQGAVCLARALEHYSNGKTLFPSCNGIGHHWLATALERNRARVLVLPISCGSQGPKRCAITCANMGSRQVAVAEVGPLQTLAMLRDAFAAELDRHGHFAIGPS